MEERAFSGIYIVEPRVIPTLAEYSRQVGSAKFPVMDYLLAASASGKNNIGEIGLDSLNLIDIGKPDAPPRRQPVRGVN